MPYGEVFAGSKIRIGDGTLLVSRPDETGRIRRSRFKVDPDHMYEWVDG